MTDKELTAIVGGSISWLSMRPPGEKWTVP